ncbi:S-adenosyl-L-methionine-dependent methyltransferase [Phycomyces nitens]|nr:S-adenosyl-L-methionine-dependent methyltransferase [Phycomyces nitens]
MASYINKPDSYQGSTIVKSKDPNDEYLLNAIPNASKREYYSGGSQTYILPCDDEEKYRLNMQHVLFEKLFNGVSRLVFSTIRDNLLPGSKIIDFGCGTGAWVIDMANAYPDLTVIGADIANVFPKDNLPPNASFLITDVSKPLPFEDNSFDIINTRILMGGLQKEKWEPMVAEFYRIVKPGGLVQLMEFDFMEKKLDFFVASKIPVLMRSNGFYVIEEDSREMKLCADGTDLSRRVIDNWTRTMIGFKGSMLKFICPENPDLYELLLEGYIKACIEQEWFKRVVGIVGRKPVV